MLPIVTKRKKPIKTDRIIILILLCERAKRLINVILQYSSSSKDSLTIFLSTEQIEEAIENPNCIVKELLRLFALNCKAIKEADKKNR